MKIFSFIMKMRAGNHFHKGSGSMRKMILTFSLGAVMGMATTLLIQSVNSGQNEFAELIKTSCEKLKSHMHSSMRKLDFATQDALEDVIESIDSIVDESLPSKVKKTLNQVKFTLSELF